MIEPPSYASATSAVAHQLTPTAAQHTISGPPNGGNHEEEAPYAVDATEEEQSPLDFTQRLERKLAEYDASQNVFKRWLFEIASWLLSAICMGAVVGIYACINRQEMVQSEQLLTLASMLGKVASAALIVPTSEALGQLKWNWFHNSKAMWDFEIFDKASRGPWGAALLLFRTKGRSLAALGALLIVLLLAIDSFFQQVVIYLDEPALQNSSSSIPFLTAYKPYYLKSYIKGIEQGVVDGSLKPIVNKYFYENGTRGVQFGAGMRPDIPLTCPSSTCDWPEYDTLGICSSCTETSHLLDIKYTCLENTTIEWSAAWDGPLSDVPYPTGTVCGYFLNSTSNAPLLLSGHVVNRTDSSSPTGETLLVRTIPLSDIDTKAPFYGVGSVNYKQIRYPILDAFVASAIDGPESVYRQEPPLVHECILSWCVQTIKSSYGWGVYSENVISEFLDVTSEPVTWPWSVKGDDFNYTQDITLQPHISDSKRASGAVFNTTYSVDRDTAFSVLVSFDDFFPSFYTAKNASSDPVLRYKNYPDGPSTRHLPFNAWQAPSNITHYMERLALSMTNDMRSDDGSREEVHGQAFDQNKFVSIKWAWLIFPFVLLILSLVFLVATIIKTSKDTSIGIWKTSAMPTLIYSLPKETQDQFTSSSTFTETKNNNKVRIRLSMNTGWRVSRQQPSSRSPQLPRPAHRASDGRI
jgi:hypothetical protein